MLATTAQHLVSDEDLVDHVRRGERAAFELLVERHENRVYRLAMRMSRNSSDAEDITQDTFLRAHGSIDSFRGHSRFGTWLYRIAMNEALMRRRAARRRPTTPLDVVAPQFEDRGHPSAATGGVCSAERLLEERQLAQRVQDALDELDEPSRAALVLRDLEELSAEEAADILGTTPQAVRQRAHRARLKLREKLFADR
jgi:RNA polymerase sigma-70 factor, ECF subfamily